MDSIFSAIAKLEKENRAGALCMVINTRGSAPRRSGSKMLVFEDGSILGTVGGGELENRVKKEGLEAIKDGKTRLLTYNMVDPSKGDPGVCGGTIEVYVEPILPKPKIIIIGAGHVGKALTHLAQWLGYYVVLSDDRAEYCNSDAAPGADEYLVCKMSEIPNKTEITPWTYLALVTRGGNVDAEGIPALLSKPFAYLGVIGSKRRWMLTKKSLMEQGVSEDVINKIKSPIGLDINTETPREIAVSIMAEIMMYNQGGSGESLSEKQ